MNTTGADVVKSTGGAPPVDWDLAVSTARRLARPGPVVSREVAEHTVGRLREVTADAEAHVRQVTGLGDGLPLLPGDVVDRGDWIQAAADSIAGLTTGSLPNRPSRVVGGVLAGTAGVQAGMVLAYLSGRVLGQYDPFGGDGGRLLLVAPNIVAAHQALDVPPEDFRMWVCLHECTHRLQFTAVPWLRAYFQGQVAAFLTGLDDSANGAMARLPELLKSARSKPDSATSSSGPLALVEMLQAPEQKAIFDRLIAISTLLEGHADHVMDAVGPVVVPTVFTIRERFTARRRGGGLLDRVLRGLLGVDAKMKQYAVGAKFTKHVVDELGMERFNVIWTSPETLPLRSELGDPAAWIRRVA
ncbi:zinc-dependent metalloprotease [Actinokineospora inagensis]|uniref:zinc-dependent metalloprotease n=1 Tax=Actinokineospora inagensis TaxID=103730 RepID=UPI00040151A8|nr:zinc-dependent metalloprotease [Actinokineospora inagensis]